MKNQNTWVDTAIANLDRAINRYPAVLGEQVKKQKQSAQDFVFDFPHATSSQNKMCQCKVRQLLTPFSRI